VDEQRLRQLHSLLGHHWDLAILTHLLEGPRKVTELIHTVHLDGRPVSERMVRQSLERFRVGGLACRQRPDDRTSPYTLTRRGGWLATAMVNLVADDDGWSD
jgi:DNA-binding HxlR family transcriptional regulator